MKTNKKGNILYDKEGNMEYSKEVEKALVRHAEMIDCVKECKEGPEVFVYTIESLRGEGERAHKVITRKHRKKTFSVCDDKRYQLEDYHTLAYGHRNAKPTIPMTEVRKTYNLKKISIKKDGE